VHLLLFVVKILFIRDRTGIIGGKDKSGKQVIRRLGYRGKIIKTADYADFTDTIL
jgi:hypothetical protein